jgi:hypothetical protein
MSGDINTGLGNCLLMSSITIAYCESRGIKHRLSNNGDDCVLFVERGDLAQLGGLDAWFLEFGFRLTREQPCYRLEEVEFCQFHPVRVGGGWRMVRDPRVAMSKDCVSLVSWQTEDEVRSWATAVSKCGISLTTGVPVWPSWYRILGRIGGEDIQGVTERVNECGMAHWARGVAACEVTDESRASFYYAFGVTPDEQIALEQAYDAIQDLTDGTPLMSATPAHICDKENPLTLLSA